MTSINIFGINDAPTANDIALSTTGRNRDGACDMPANTVSLDGGDVWYNVDFAIGGFQWTVDGATVTATSGGDAAAAGFTVQAAGTTVLGFYVHFYCISCGNISTSKHHLYILHVVLFPAAFHHG